jgi:hypothetical protein
MELLKCSNCEQTNCYIQYNNWLVCRECGQASFFDWESVAPGIKVEIFNLMKDRAELGTSNKQITNLINAAKVKSNFWPIGEFELTNAEEYAKYYNLFIYLKYGVTGLSAASEKQATRSVRKRGKKDPDSNANGSG